MRFIGKMRVQNGHQVGVVTRISQFSDHDINVVIAIAFFPIVSF